MSGKLNFIPFPSVRYCEVTTFIDSKDFTAGAGSGTKLLKNTTLNVKTVLGVLLLSLQLYIFTIR